MSFKDLDVDIKAEYRSKIDNIAKDFFIPLLNEAVSYRRSVGFFSSSVLIEISKGICSLAKRGGKIQLVASPNLSDEDVAAIRKGYSDRDKIIEGALLRSIPVKSTDYYSLERLNLLAALIADGILDFKIVYIESEEKIGMYHEKMGIIEDEEGSKIAFSGSMNETYTGISVNYEAIDVYCDWKSTESSNRVALKDNAFFSIWNNVEPNIVVKEFNSVKDAFIHEFRKNSPNFEIDEQQFKRSALKSESVPDKKFIGARIPEDVKLYDYQKEAINSWVKNDYCGIFDMATGTGKTYTGLAAIARLSEDLGDKLAVIIVCPYQHLVEQWVEDIKRFNIDPIVGYSSSSQKNWKERLSKAVFDQKIRTDRRFFCFICTNATFKSSYVQEEINRIKSSILLVVDEAHNFGTEGFSKFLDNRFKYKLALSATFERHRDNVGTEILYKFFGNKCIEYTLERAIEEGKLTRYRYYPVVVYLEEDELAKYEQLSREISKCVIMGKNGQKKLNKKGEILALQRARLVAGAQQKLEALRKQMQPYKNESHILVYCGSSNLNDENNDESVNNAEIRQIDAVIRILGNELNMRVSRFTSYEDMETRAMIKERFQAGDRQAIVAIKCLDEGVNIPAIKTAFILASTTNPKEYIQRRGRVLRKAEGKEYAEIYDFVTLPRSLDVVPYLTVEQVKRDESLVKNELVRIKEFCRLADNSMESNKLILKIQNAYNLRIDIGEGEFVYG